MSFDDALPFYYGYSLPSRASLSSKAKRALVYTLLLVTQLVDTLSGGLADLGEQLIDLLGSLIDLLNRLAHAPTREAYRRVRGILILLAILPLTWAVLVFVLRVPMPALHLQVAW